MKENKIKYKKMHDSYQKYKIFYENHRLTLLAVSESLFFVVRRIIFITSALYWTEGNYVLLAIACFVLSALIKLIFIISVRPFTEKQHNFTEGMNELFIVSVGYFAIPLMDQSMPRLQILAVGSAIAYIIYALLIFSVLCLVVSLIVQIRNRIKKTAFEKVIKSQSGRAMLQRVHQKAQTNANAHILDQLKMKPHDNFTIKLIKCELLEKLLNASMFQSGNVEVESDQLSELIVEEVPESITAKDDPLTSLDVPHQSVAPIRLAEIGVVSTLTKHEKYRRSIYRAMGRDDPESSCSSFESEEISAFASSQLSISSREVSSLEIIDEVDEDVDDAPGANADQGNESDRFNFTERKDDESMKLNDGYQE